MQSSTLPEPTPETPDTVDPVVIAPGFKTIRVPFGTSSLPSIDAAVISWVSAASATDDRDGVVSVANDARSSFSLGGTVVTFTATHTAGNVGTDSSILTIVIENDVTPPVVTPPASFEIEVPFGTTSVLDSNPDVAAWLALASVFDERGDVLAIGHSPTSFSPGPTLVTFSATDAAANTGSDSATLTVTVLSQTFDLALIASPGIGGSVSGNGTYAENDDASVSATPATDYQFDGWTGPDAAECATGTVSMTANKSCTANFSLIVTPTPEP